MSANLEQLDDRLLVLRVSGELKKSELDAVQSEFVRKMAGGGTVKLLVLLEKRPGGQLNTLGITREHLQEIRALRTS